MCWHRRCLRRLWRRRRGQWNRSHIASLKMIVPLACLLRASVDVAIYSRSGIIWECGYFNAQEWGREIDIIIAKWFFGSLITNKFRNCDVRRENPKRTSWARWTTKPSSSSCRRRRCEINRAYNYFQLSLFDISNLYKNFRSFNLFTT